MIMGQSTLNIVEGRRYPIYWPRNLDGGVRSPHHTNAWEEMIARDLFHSHSEPSTIPLLLQFNTYNSPSRSALLYSLHSENSEA